MPNRILKESVCTSDSIDSLSWFEECLFYRLIVNCDDFGRFDGRVAVIKNRLFPLKDKLTLKSVSDAINNLESAGLVMPYDCDGKPFLYLPSWNEHQNVRAKRSKYPEPKAEKDSMHTSVCKCMQMNANVPDIQSNPNPIRNPNTETRVSRFQDFFSAYPKQKNLIAAEKEYNLLLFNDQKLTEQELIIAAENYADAVCILGTDDRYIKNPDRFLKDGTYIDYLDANYTKPKPPAGKRNANTGIMRADYGDLSELEKELLSN